MHLGDVSDVNHKRFRMTRQNACVALKNEGYGPGKFASTSRQQT